jgi:hypothetical protein
MKQQLLCNSMATLSWLVCIFIVSVISLATGELAQQVLQPFRYGVLEKQIPGVAVADLTRDLLQRAPHVARELQFYIVSQEVPLFNLSSYGLLSTTTSINRDSLCPQQVTCTVALRVAAHAPPDFVSLLDVTVDVIDVSDYAPVFASQSVTLSIYEQNVAGLTLRLPTATDLDSPQYGIATYQLLQQQDTSSNIAKEGVNLVSSYDSDNVKGFALKVNRDGRGNVMPYLAVNFVLDRETLAYYTLTIVCFSRGPQPQLNGTLTVNIVVLDVNDNSPVFDNTTYVATVPENKANIDVIKVRALDPDLGSSGNVTYAFDTTTTQRYGHLFSIDASAGTIHLLAPLKYDGKTTYVLRVVAQDLGPESTPSDAEVIVTVTSNFTTSPGIIVTSLTSDGQLVATDRDIPGTFVALVMVKVKDVQGKRWTCSVDSSELTLVTIDGTNLKLLTSDCLAVDSTSGMTFINATISCKSLSDQSQRSLQAISVLVTKKQVSSPLKFASNILQATVLENNPLEAPIIKLNATDSYCDRSVTYKLMTSLCDNYIRVDVSTGLVTAKAAFNYEQLATLECVIEASDINRHPQSASVTLHINVIDVDDVPPVFSLRLYTFHVSEALNGSVLIGQVVATDNESAPFNEFTIGIDTASTVISQHFYVNPSTGFITLLQPLDREKQSIYTFSVKATAKLRPHVVASALVQIYVDDANDNEPVVLFPKPGNDTLYVSPHVSVGFELPPVLAFDPDKGLPCSLHYSLLAGPFYTYFHIDSVTGTVYTQRLLLDLEGANVPLDIFITDCGPPSQHTVHVRLNVIVNETLAVLTGRGAMPTGASLQLPSHIRLPHNYVIIITICIITAVLTAVLLIAIIRLRACEKAHRQGSYKFAACSTGSGHPATPASIEAGLETPKLNQLPKANQSNCAVMTSRETATLSTRTPAEVTLPATGSRQIYGTATMTLADIGQSPSASSDPDAASDTSEDLSTDIGNRRPLLHEVISVKAFLD